MLIEFRVANFRSIRDEQRLSLVASNTDTDLPGSVIERDLPGLSGVRFLKGAAIYGANASGKSNLLEAIKFLASFIEHSATSMHPGENIGVQPFKLDDCSTNRPSEFEITFAVEDVRYLFGLSLTAERIVEEYLVAYPKGTPQRWYTRKYNEETQSYDWSRPAAGFKYDRNLQDRTRQNSLFLSVGPQFNHSQLLPIYDWFRTRFDFMHLDQGMVDAQLTSKLFVESAYRQRFLNLLQSADLGVANASVRVTDASFGGFRVQISPESLAEFERRGLVNPSKEYQPQLSHRMDGTGTKALDFDKEESAGTQAFFGLIGPWLRTLETASTVFVDEIESSLHPFLVRELLKLFFSEGTNPKGAQVIFTTHNPLLLDKELLRRDQVWFTEKSRDGATHLYPLTDYKPRKDEARTAGYLAGRYGGVPFIPEGLQL